MRRTARSLGLAWAIAGTIGCGNAPTEAPRPPETPVREAPEIDEPPPAPHPEPPPPPTEITIAEASGTIEIDRVVTPLVRDGLLHAGQRISLHDDARLVFDFLGEGRVELEPSSVAEVTDGPMDVVVARGAARIFLTPSGSGERPPMRAFTPTAAVWIGAMGDALVHVATDGSTWIAVLSGRVRVDAGDRTADGRLESVDLAAGQAIEVRGPLVSARRSEGPARLEDARRLLEARERGGAPLGARGLAAVERFDEALGWVEAEKERGEQANAAHARAVAAHDEAAAREQMRVLVDHGQQQLYVAEVVRARRGAAEALALRDPEVRTAIAARLERFRAAITP